ncbi:MAG: GAF domain-containing protein [Deltaproteobacteria bacterium]|nr:GAF domain-containing protein [Deltaproteobacteria bacterium]
MASGEQQVDGELAAARARYERDELLGISRALSSERDIRALLDLILLKSRQITGADAGSVYVLETQEVAGQSPASSRKAARRRSAGLGERRGGRAVLHFMLSQNDSMAIDFQESRLAVDDSSVAGKAVLGGKPINIADFSTLAGADAGGLTHNRSFDQKTGYQTRSMLTVPMTSAVGDVIGVIQLINKKRTPSRRLAGPDDFVAQVIPFDQRAVEMAEALAAQAGVSLENAILYDEIRRLFEGFVDAAVTAIESRDPTTSGHSRRVATLAVALAEKVDALADGPLGGVHFSRDNLRQIEYAGVLHDFGKVGVREQVLVKAKKLYDWQLAGVSTRFRYIRKAVEAETLRGKLALLEAGGADGKAEAAALDRELGARLAVLDESWRVVVAANEPTALDGSVLARLDEIAKLTYTDENGQAQPFLTPEELCALQVARGSLTQDERQQIQSHVAHTVAFLRNIPWGRTLASVPRIAGAHHELLDGSGYPARLRGDEIPIEARMLTIADIFDALTAADRPYKAAVPVERALDILGNDVRAGKCDAELFRVFVEAEIWKRGM